MIPFKIEINSSHLMFDQKNYILRSYRNQVKTVLMTSVVVKSFAPDKKSVHMQI